jgi:hypothetical protein
MVVANFLVLASEFPHFPLPPTTPRNNRTYLEFPTELVWTDQVQRIPARQVKSEAFVFVESWIQTGEGERNMPGDDKWFFCPMLLLPFPGPL